jgi:molybdopterin/thiamine biosynthesis adenylyltransferase
MKTTNPKLAPGVRFYERGQTHLQIGINPSSALVIDKQVGKVIAKLLTGAHSISEICKQLAKVGHDLQSSENFLNQLVELGLVEPGPIAATYDQQNPVSEIQRLNLVRETHGDLDAINRRIGCEISIRGAGRLGMTVCLLLASAGFPNITVHDSTLVSESDLTPWGASRIDIGIRRDVVAKNLVERMIRGVSAHKNSLRYRSNQKIEILLPDQRADFPWISAISADALVATDTPHLFASTSSSESLVSSVINPGQTPCLRCLHLHKCDQDPQWPIIDLQVSQNPVVDSAGITLILRTAIEVTRIVSAWIDSPETLESHLLKLGQTWACVEMYPTFYHPSCGCRWDLTA